MTSLDNTTTTLISQEPPGRSFDEEQMAAASFLARYNGRTLEAYRDDLRGFFQWAHRRRRRIRGQWVNAHPGSTGSCRRRRGDRFHRPRHDCTRQVPEVTSMPRSIQEILDRADELAQRFESYEPDAADERPVEESMLEHAALARARSERQVADAVIAARGAGASWQKIGSLLGTSAQAAQQRYGALIDES